MGIDATGASKCRFIIAPSDQCSSATRAAKPAPAPSRARYATPKSHGRGLGGGGGRGGGGGGGGAAHWSGGAATDEDDGGGADILEPPLVMTPRIGYDGDDLALLSPTLGSGLGQDTERSLRGEPVDLIA